MTPTLMRQDETKRAEKNPQTTAPAVGTGREDLGKGIRQSQEVIRWESLKLHELDKDWARKRKKTMTIDEEIRKLEIEVTQAGRTEKIGMMRWGLASPSTALEEVVTLWPWLQPHLTKQWNVPYTEERDALTGARVVGGARGPS